MTLRDLMINLPKRDLPQFVPDLVTQTGVSGADRGGLRAALHTKYGHPPMLTVSNTCSILDLELEGAHSDGDKWGRG